MRARDESSGHVSMDLQEMIEIQQIAEKESWLWRSAVAPGHLSATGGALWRTPPALPRYSWGRIPKARTPQRGRAMRERNCWYGRGTWGGWLSPWRFWRWQCRTASRIRRVASIACWSLWSRPWRSETRDFVELWFDQDLSNSPQLVKVRCAQCDFRV